MFGVAETTAVPVEAIRLSILFRFILDDEIGGADYKKSHEMVYGNTSYSEIGKTNQNYDFEIYNYDYKTTADKYKVPYSQVYTWVQKVKTNGYEGLILKKKGPKSKYLVEPKTPEEILELENERLRRENERLQLELEVLKKKHRLQKRANTQR